MVTTFLKLSRFDHCHCEKWFVGLVSGTSRPHTTSSEMSGPKVKFLIFWSEGETGALVVQTDMKFDTHIQK